MPRWGSWATRPARSGYARSMPWAARSSPMPAWTSPASSSVRRCWPRSPAVPCRRPSCATSMTPSLASSSTPSAGRHPRTPRPIAAFAAYQASPAQHRGHRPRRPRGAGRTGPAARTRHLLATLAGAGRGPLRGRSPGPRQEPARPGPATGRGAARHLPRRATTTRPSTPGAWPTSAACSAWPRACPACGASTSRPTIAARRRSCVAPPGWSSTTRSASTSASWPRRGPSGSVTLLPDRGDEVARARLLLGTWAREPAGERHAVLARTNRELVPVRRGRARAGPALPRRGRRPAARRCAHRRGARGAPTRAARSSVAPARGRRACAAAGRARDGPARWAGPPASPTSAGLRAGAAATPGGTRAAAAHDEAALTLATAHGTKGLEWDHVACIGHDEGTFPSGRALREADEPVRVLEEERRLAYVAWTRARKTLTIVYDPGAPSTLRARGLRSRRARLSDAAPSPSDEVYHRAMSTPQQGPHRRRIVGHPQHPPEGLRLLHHDRLRGGRRAAARGAGGGRLRGRLPAQPRGRDRLPRAPPRRWPRYAAVILSDIGSNTLLLHPETFGARCRGPTGWPPSATTSRLVAGW